MKMEKLGGGLHRFFKVTLKLLSALLLLFYVMIGINATISLVEKTLNRRQDISALPALIDEKIKADDLHAVTKWVAFRPMAETDKLIATLTPRSGELEPAVFVELAARQLQLGHKEDALFWSQLARYRLRYDALRCGVKDADKILDKMMDYFTPKEINALLRQHPDLMFKSVQQILDFDKKYPASNSPTYICGTINKFKRVSVPPIPQEKWENTRLWLRQGTEVYLQQYAGKK
jgi:hypothetical protein